MNDLEKATGVSAGIISRFLRDERTLTLATAERLANHLGLVLVRPGGAGKLRRGVARMVLAGAIAASQVDPGPLTDSLAVLISIGHSQSEARLLIEKATSGGAEFATAADILAAVYRPSKAV